MQDSTAPSRDGATAFTLREAATFLGISLNTLRRRIAAGQIDAQQIHRPQGHVWQVYLHGADTQEHRSTGTVQEDGATTVQHPATPSAPAAQAEALSTLVQATVATVLGPLVAELAAVRQTSDARADRIAELEREAGRYAAERDAAEARYGAMLAAHTVARSSEPAVTIWRRWWPAALVLAGVLAFIALLVWPR